MKKSMFRLILLGMSLLLSIHSVFGLTKTVDAAGGGEYTTLAAAVTAMESGAWGAGPHTILITSTQVNPIATRITIVSQNVTIKNAPGQLPVLLVDQINLGNAHIFYIGNTSQVTVEGLRFIGTAGSMPSDSDNCLFRLENASAGRQTFTLRNCLITANNGSNAPLTSYTNDRTTVRGYFYNAILPYRGGNTGPIDTLVEGSTIAYCEGGIAMLNSPVPGGSLTVRNTLFAQKMNRAINFLANNYAGNPVVIDECAFVHFNEGATEWEPAGVMANPGANNLNLTISDTVFRSRWGSAVHLRGFDGGTLNLRRVTTNVGRRALEAVLLTGSNTFTVEDLVWRFGENRATDTAFSFSNSSGSSAITLNNLAVFEGRYDPVAVSPQFNAALVAEGMLEDDPLFVRDTFGAGEVGLIGWDRLQNDFLDVNNTSLIGQGAPGQRPDDTLSGGADPGAGINPTQVVVSTTEVWNGIANPHAANGVTLSGSGSPEDPYIYRIPAGMLITGSGMIQFTANAEMRLVFETGGGGLTMQSGGRIDLNKGGDRLTPHGFELDLGNQDLTGQGRFVTTATGAHSLRIVNAGTVALNSIDLHRVDAAVASVFIEAAVSVTVTGAIDTREVNAGGGPGGHVAVRARQIALNSILTGSARTGSSTYNGDIVLRALAPAEYDAQAQTNNTIANTLTLNGALNTNGALASHGGGRIIIEGVLVTLANGFSLQRPANAQFEFRSGVVQGSYIATDLFRDQVPGGSGLSSDHEVQWTTTPKLLIEATEPPNAADLIQSPPTIDVNFNFPVSAASLQAADLKVDGQPALGFQFLDPHLVRFNLGSLSGTGVHTVNIAANTLQSVSGLDNLAYAGTFRLLGPPTISGQAVSSLSSTAVKFSATVTQAPRVWAYYGAADGGSNPAAWPNAKLLGTFADGSVFPTLTGLNPNQSYFCRLYAENGAGSAWAGTSLFFTTSAAVPADGSVVASWLFDEFDYENTTLTDAGPGLYDLRLAEQGALQPGRFGHALATGNGAGFNLYYAEWSGMLPVNAMFAGPNRPGATWGPTIAPEKILNALTTDWTIEFWIKSGATPASEVAILHCGHAYDPGLTINLLANGTHFRVRDDYAGFEALCPTAGVALFNGAWQHVAFTHRQSDHQLQHFVNGVPQAASSVSVSPVRSKPPVVLPASLATTNYGIFDASGNHELFRQNRFNLSLGEDRHGAADFAGMFDELRISNTRRYSSGFTPASISRAYATIAPPPSVPTGPALLFGADAPGQILKLGARKHVFIDEAIIETKQNIQTRVNPPLAEGLNTNFNGDFSAVDYQGKVYVISPDSYASDKGLTSLLESTDGRNFSTRNLGVVNYQGSTNNSLILAYQPNWCGVTEDLNPNAPASERYKMFSWLANKGIYLYTSPDVVHWTRNESIIVPLVSGGSAEGFWDDQTGLYRCYIKRDGNFTPEIPDPLGRVAMGFETREILKPWPFRAQDIVSNYGWTIPYVTGEGDLSFPVNQFGQVYRTRALKYPWAPDVYLAFVWRFDQAADSRQTELMVSRDGVNWKSTGQYGMYLPKGGTFSGFPIVEAVVQYGLIRRGAQLWHYGEYSTTGHNQGGGVDYSVKLTQRLDGFVSLDATTQTGTLTTRPFIFEGNRLELNVAASGYLKIEMQNLAGVALPGFELSASVPITTNSTAIQANWQGNPSLQQYVGQPVRLRFELQNAKLYAFEFLAPPAPGSAVEMGDWASYD